MSFTPAIPYSGADGWAWMRENLAALQSASDAAAGDGVEADLAYFRANIDKATSPAALINNQALARVALTAFGLEKDPPSAGFLERVLSRGTESADALARDIGDPRYVELARAFGYGPYTEPRVTEAGFAEEIVARYRIHNLEESVGAADPAMRRALAFERTMKSLAAAGFAPGDGWERALADHSVREVLSDTFDLPANFDRLSLARQAEIAESEMLKQTGAIAVDAFAEEATRDAFIKRHLDAAALGRRGFGGAAPRPPGSGALGFDILTGGLDRSLEAFADANRRDPDLAYFARALERLDPAGLRVTDPETGVTRGATLTEAFVADERLKGLALEAFGLADRAPTDAFLTAVLDSDPADPNSFAAALDDPRWSEMARVFGFGSGGGPQIRRFGFADEIADRVHLHRFEAAIGAQDADMRLALVVNRTLEAVASEGLDEDAAWRKLLGNDAARRGLGVALGLTDAFATLGLSGQTTAARDAAARLFGTDRIADLGDGFRRDQVIDRFFREAARDDAPRGGLATPTIPLDGVAGWRFLQRTLDSQRESFAASFQMRAEIDYFRANIAEIGSAEALMADVRLRNVALTAFGLGSEVDKGAFMETVLAEGTERDDALAVNLADPRYRELASAFGFGDGKGAQTRVEGFADRIVARYVEHAFEEAVGGVDESMRLALNFERQSQAIIASGVSDRAAWFRALGEPPMRRVLESAFNLPSEFAQADLDYQVEQLQTRAQSAIGSPSFSALLDAGARETLIGRFFIGESLAQTGYSPFSTALSLLQGAGGGGGLNALL